MSRKLGIGVIGCGGIMNGAHFPGYLHMDNVEVIAFCDIIVERAQSAANRYQSAKNCPAPQVFEKYIDLINMPGIEAVDICTPNYLHSIIAVEALNHGLHVFCEKPDAINVIEAEKMKVAAEKSGKTLMVMRNNRYRGSSQFLKKHIEEGKMGEIYAARCGWQRRRGGPPHGSWFSNKAESGGGPLIDLGVHMIDLTMWLMGNPKPVTVSGCTYNKFGNDGSCDGILKEGEKSIFDVEDLAMAFIRFENGACLQVEVSWASNIIDDDLFVELRGTKEGAIDGRASGGRLKLFGYENGAVTDMIPCIYDQCPQHEANIRHFADVVLNGVKPMFVPEQGLNMVKILEGIYKSAESGHEIVL